MIYLKLRKSSRLKSLVCEIGSSEQDFIRARIRHIESFGLQFHKHGRQKNCANNES